MSDAHLLITENIDIWTTAIKKRSSQGRGSNKKIELTGIKKLRELILELAVRGKLVPQAPNDEPASILLEKITAEKKQLIKDKKIKKPKSLPEIDEDEKSLKLPNGWEWIRLGNFAEVKGGKRLPKGHVLVNYKTPYAYIRVTDMKEGSININRLLYLEGQTQELIKQYTISKSDLYITIAGTIGNIGTIPDELDGMNLTENAAKIIFSSVNRLWLKQSLSASFSQRQFLEKTNQLAQPKLALHRILSSVIALPPPAEQHRIVTKADELMLLCDQLEQQTEDSITAHQTLVETLLATLSNSENTAEFNQNWTRIAEHFDTLFTTEHSIDQLKQTILQLAVMGKLVPQNPNDEPASVLLEKIAAEKEQLIKDKKIKKQKPLITFEGLDDLKKALPSSWEWVRLADTADLVRGGSPRPAGDPRFYDGKIPFLKVGDVTRKKSKFVEGFNATIKEAGLKKTRLIEVRTVLLSNSGATLGIPAICDFPATFNDGIAAFIERSEFVFDEYLYLYLSTLSRWFLDIASRGQGQPNLNTDIIKSTWFALPPLPEQHRIVTKVDALMTLCDQLKARLSEAQTTQLQLADAVVGDVCGYQPNKPIESKAEAIIMKITTTLTLGEQYTNQDDAILAAIINKEGLEVDAKIVWNKSKYDLPAFYKQLKKEINAGYINQPAQANFEN